MTTGAPIYLVSACASGEEFISAFRRYADRNGVMFIPIAAPLPPGRKGRFALTLKDGGVMIEGVAEVVSSAKTPSVLYGRVGMTLKFTEPDEPSKTLLGELEKARLQMKPAPPSVAPRPAEIPTEPRPTPPAPAGRIDAVNALAECVVIGDPSTLTSDDGPKAGPRFTVPAIPPVGGKIQPKSPSVREAPSPSPSPTTMPPIKAPTGLRQPTPPRAVPIAAPARAPTPATALPVVGKATVMGMPVATPIVARPPPTLTPAPPAVPTPILPPIHDVDDADEPTNLTGLPLVPVEQVASEQSGPERAVHEPRKTVIGIAVVPSGVHVLPAAPARRVASEDEVRDTSVMEAAGDEPSGAVMITSSPPKEFSEIALGATQTAGQKLPSGVMNATIEEATPSGDWTMTPGEHGPTIAPRAPTPAPVAAAKPRVQTADPKEDAPINQIPADPQTGDWMIALDPSQPDGWSEPSRVEKNPEGVLEEPGPPVSTVASAKDLDSNAKVAPEPKVPDAAKVEVDPTLMEPLQPIDDFDDEPRLPPPPAAAMPAMMGLEAPTGGQLHTSLPHTPAQIQMQMPGPLPGSYVTTVPGQMQLANSSGQVQAYSMDPAQLQMGQPRGVTDAGTGFFRDTNEVPRYPTDSSPALADEGGVARKRRLIVIIASASGALLLVILFALVLGGGTPAPPPKHPDPPLPPKAEGSSGSAQPATVNPTTSPDAAVQPARPDATEQVAAATECEVEFSSAPQGADIVLGKDVVGTTPAKLTLPCGVESRLTFKKQRFVAAQRVVTPKATGQKPVRVALARVTFIVKVSSSPPGATIFLGAKSLGTTPAAIKLPAFEASTLKITKDGYAPDLQKITPKTNNLSISSTLKKQPIKKQR